MAHHQLLLGKNHNCEPNLLSHAERFQYILTIYESAISLTVSFYMALLEKLISLMRLKTEGREGQRASGKRQKEGKGARSSQTWLCSAFGNDRPEQLCMKAVTLAVASVLLLSC